MDATRSREGDFGVFDDPMVSPSIGSGGKEMYKFDTAQTVSVIKWARVIETSVRWATTKGKGTFRMIIVICVLRAVCLRRRKLR